MTGWEEPIHEVVIGLIPAILGPIPVFSRFNGLDSSVSVSGQDTRDRGGHEAGEAATDQGFDPELGEVLPLSRSDGTDASDLDTDGYDIGETGQRVGHDHQVAGVGIDAGALELCKVDESDKFVEHGAGAEQGARLEECIVADTHQPRYRGEKQSEDEFERKGFEGAAGHGSDEVVQTEGITDPMGEHIVDEGDEGDKDDQHATDINGEFDPIGRAEADGVEEVGADLLLVDFEAGVHGFSLWHEDFSEHQSGGRGDDRLGNKVGGKDDLLRRISASEETDVGDKHGTRDRGHAADHDAEQLRAGHGVEVGLDQQGGLGLPEKHIGRGAEGFRTGEPHGLGHHPSEAPDDLLEDTEVVEGGREGGEKDN